MQCNVIWCVTLCFVTEEALCVMVNRRYRCGLLALVLGFMLMFSAESACAWQKKFMFLNFSGRTIWHLYIKGSSWKGGYRDLLGASFLPDDGVKQYKYSGRHKVFDIMIVFREGDHLSYRRIDFRNIKGLKLVKRNGKYRLMSFYE